MKAIVYVSETGHTKRYAELLAAQTGLPALPLKAALKTLAPGTEIIYMGWVMAGNVTEYSKAKKKFKIKILCSVGMSQCGNSVDIMKQKAESEGVKFFHLRGGVDWSRLKGLNRIMLKLAVKVIIEKTLKDPNLSPEEKEQAVESTKGRDYVSQENLLPVIECVKSA